MAKRINSGSHGALLLTRWGFYMDLPVGFGRVLVCEIGRSNGSWIHELGWRYAR